MSTGVSPLHGLTQQLSTHVNYQGEQTTDRPATAGSRRAQQLSRHAGTRKQPCPERRSLYSPGQLRGDALGGLQGKGFGSPRAGGRCRCRLRAQPWLAGPVYVSAARGAGPPAGRRGRQGLGLASRHAAREDPGLASWGPRSERRPETAPPLGRGCARPLRSAAASRGGGASGGSALGRRLTQSGRVSRDTEATPNRKRTKKITVRDAESKRTRSHHEQQRSISNTAYLPCATSWESSIPSDLTPSSGSTLHRRSAGVLRALSSKLCSSRGCHSPHHVSCVSWRLSVSAYGPVCGCWAFRLHYPHGLLSSRSHLSTWLSSAGRRRV